MDQDSTNGASGDKPKWRERLGIGAKDMPKISDEFRTQPFATPAEKPDVRVLQPVTKLAPMAPRAHGPQTARANRDARRSPEPQNSEGLAEKLRAQRAAAEMLAVQRVSAARQRAEARIAAEPRSPAPRASVDDTPSKDATPPRPKFSFADDNEGAKRQEAGFVPDKNGGNGAQRNPIGAASLIPPRPALGGERPQPSILRQPGSPYRPELPPAFRPIDPATGYTAPPSRTVPLGTPRPYPPEPGLASVNRNSRTPSYDPYRRGQEIARYGAETGGENTRGDHRLGRALAARGQGQAIEEEPDDVFEDEAPARRRAGASDYRSAYREAEEGDTEDRRRSNGPWLLLLALLVAAFATGGVIWLYNNNALTTASNSTPDTVPVVAAPDEPAKTAAEKPADGAGDVASVNKKQIYDRIVGDQEVTGDKVVPTEVTPIQPEPEEGAETGGVLRSTGASGENADDVVPLALPPAPGEESEGRIDQGTDQKVVATAGQSGVEEVRSQTTTSGSGESIASLLPATGSNEDAAVPQTAESTTNTTSSASTDSSSAASSESVEPEVQPPLAAEEKPAAIKKKKPAADDATATLGAEPVVLVPPGEIAAPSQEGFGQSAEPETLSATDTAQNQPPVRRKRTLFDLFNRNKSEATSTPDAVAVEKPAAQQTTETNVASLPEETITPVPEKQLAGGGYVVQLASFRSEVEAQTEYARLRSKYPSVIGTLPSSISQATVAGSTRHRLGLGPLATRDQASQICNSLIAGGERDCLVRKQ